MPVGAILYGCPFLVWVYYFLGVTLVDTFGNYDGPLAGMVNPLAQAQTDYSYPI